ncbi:MULTISPECIES: 2'-5' RNA ligase family protein [unclassified Nonomuraea]|uniref:2'-5' RNA ligase family protein n=1 Tax=unclassified Nonomuraea TaxID=2593643 RepID=UPI0033DED38C
MEGQRTLHDFAAKVQPELEATGALGPIPIEWLHMTVQGVGFTDEVSREDLSAISEAVSRRLVGIGPLSVTLGPLVADAEGVNLPVRFSEAVDAVRRAIRAGIGDIWGAERVPETADGFRPHVSLAYSHISGAPLAPIREVLARHAMIIPVTLTRVTLIDINRDERVYRWQVLDAPSLS